MTQAKIPISELAVWLEGKSVEAEIMLQTHTAAEAAWRRNSILATEHQIERIRMAEHEAKARNKCRRDLKMFRAVYEMIRSPE